MSADREHQLLVDELNAAVGEDAVERRPPGSGRAFRSARLMLLVVGGAVLVAGVIASLALDNWIFFAVAILAYALFTIAVIGSAVVLAADTKQVDRRRRPPS